MPRFYSPEWVDAFNAGVADLDVGATNSEGSLVASSGHFCVAQSVPDAPGGEITVTLLVTDGRCSLRLDATETPDVTVSLSYADAAALSRGELDASQALGAGRVRVRGDLSVLVAAQSLLRAAAECLGDLRAATTY